MQTFFARHRTDISQDTFRRLWEERWVAIYYPHTRYGENEEDSTSLDHNDFEGTAKGALRALIELAKDGGYVCAEYEGYQDCLIGKVPAGSNIELLYGNRGGNYSPPSQKAILKAVRLQQVRTVSPREHAMILVGRPRQGTLQRWRQAGRVIERLVEGEEVDPSLDNLLPNQQEVMCSEFLMSPITIEIDLPRLAHHLLPVGRTLKDLDILEKIWTYLVLPKMVSVSSHK